MSVDMAQRIVRSFESPYSQALIYISKENFVTVSDLERVSRFGNWRLYEHGYVFGYEEGWLFMRFDDGVAALACQLGTDAVVYLTGRSVSPPTFYLQN